eukprot:15392990-Heterocapsa_arctica.AAC.1
MALHLLLTREPHPGVVIGARPASDEPRAYRGLEPYGSWYFSNLLVPVFLRLNIGLSSPKCVQADV